MNNKIIYLLSTLMSFANILIAQEEKRRIEERNKWYIPDYIKLQFAGNIGFMSLGPGYEWWRGNAKTDILYGYVPESVGNAAIHTFTVKNTFSLYDMEISKNVNINPTAGFSISLEPGENSYLRVPSRFPENYYSTHAIYACINLGVNIKLKFDPESFWEKLDLFWELTTTGEYLYYSLIAEENWNKNVISNALGIAIYY